MISRQNSTCKVQNSLRKQLANCTYICNLTQTFYASYVSRKLKEAEANLNSSKIKLESTKQRENNLQTENSKLKSEKDSLSKDLDATKYTLGNCKNKNMDHEVRSLELLQEIEGLKKELKAC